MKTKGKGLGRGLDAIFSFDNTEPAPRSENSSIEQISIADIVPNPGQPRTNFDEDSLEELADSIKTLGIIQPITVRKEDGGKYTIISGERRWRASQLASLESIPAFIREADDQNLHEMALVENIQRQDLNAMEVALSLQRLIDECGLTQDKLSERVGKKRSTIANYMRLLKLPSPVQLAVSKDAISMGHAKAIASAPEALQLGILKRIVKKELSVRQAEELVKKLSDKSGRASVNEDYEYPESYGKLVEQLEKFFCQNIAIKKGKKSGGKIVIEFENDAEIDQFVSRFEKINR